MSLRGTGRHSLALIISGAVHVALIVALLAIPKRAFDAWDVVDMSIAHNEPKPPPPPPPPPPPEEKVEPKAPKAKPKEKIEQPPPQPEPEPPKPEAPPVFDLGDNTFAKDGSGASWALGRSEGNTKIGAMAKPGQKSARGTSAESGSGSDTGFKPVPAKDLSRRPEPRDGEIPAPPYPPDARREGIEGRVVLQVFIGKDGAVKNVRVIKDPGGGLGAAAKAAMIEERWRPALDKSGKAVDTVITYAYLFVLDG